MSDDVPILTPADFVSAQALAFGALGESATLVSAESPLPTTSTVVPASTAPLLGTASGAGTAGPFAPELGRPICVTLSGTWTGSVTILRSTDGGATMHPLTLGGGAWAGYTANANESFATETVAGATYYLQTAIITGTVAYRVEQ